ncbi:hypothetical protein OQH60_00730 [Campylobacter sp. MIT 21-1685]|uniref:hypothetical protein n=1 Tax=unclassified Campylobacter TaxID=2593542 RepID=UPI00224A4DDA|nr:MULTISPECIES: hypothetical protein [unclassified Campylobacter]MCX2682288.1 hypothetical protein [Campylobacter sp. MIT 21-1684]MCX2750568.1 hypothetical protein [Campylobacter sp. MIT 21-1682]MCX2806884.1 hypothetical protein [Campylobacter sp. MIT 21-1685]
MNFIISLMTRQSYFEFSQKFWEWKMFYEKFYFVLLDSSCFTFIKNRFECEEIKDRNCSFSTNAKKLLHSALKNGEAFVYNTCIF